MKDNKLSEYQEKIIWNELSCPVNKQSVWWVSREIKWKCVFRVGPKNSQLPLPTHFTFIAQVTYAQTISLILNFGGVRTWLIYECNIEDNRAFDGTEKRGGGQKIHKFCHTCTISNVINVSMLQNLGRMLITLLWPFPRCNEDPIAITLEVLGLP